MSRRRRKGRGVSGILLLDKPGGITSNEALQRVRRLYEARKAGHTGSLDVIATGMLPLCFGEATKISGFLLNANKRYQVTCKLGENTLTGDRSGELRLKRPVPSLNASQVKQVLEQFRGAGEQIPPMYSALKHQGTRLHELARKGIEVERAPRRIYIYELKLLKLEAERIELHLLCSKGTYVRTLVEDIGEELGCGGHVEALRRLQSGPFTADQMISMPKLEQFKLEGLSVLDALLRPMDEALEDQPKVTLNDGIARYLLQGQPVLIPRAPTEGLVRLYAQPDRFLGVGRVLSDGRISLHRLVREKAPDSPASG